MIEKANILVVDDEVGPRESVKIILSPYYNVYTADRSAQAIEILSRIPIDLITVDLNMPGLSGLGLLEKVKHQGHDVEAIIITGYGSLETAVEGLRLGIFDYISKPFDVNHILSQVNNAVNRRRARRNLKQIKSDFLSNISHELRTPLSVVMGFVNLLLDHAVGSLTEKQTKVIEKVYKNSKDLLDLIDNVLWVNYLNTGDMSLVLEEVDVKVVIQESVKCYEEIIKQNIIDLSIELPSIELRILSDQSKVSRIFHNLFQNAIKFTPQGRITIKGSLVMNERSVVLEIIDSGAGFPENEIENMFEPFQQVESSPQRKFSGLGLGLTVSRQLMEFLGGTLHITSEPGIGTHVVLRFPFQTEDHRDQGSQPRS